MAKRHKKCLWRSGLLESPFGIHDGRMAKAGTYQAKATASHMSQDFGGKRRTNQMGVPCFKVGPPNVLPCGALVKPPKNRGKKRYPLKTRHPDINSTAPSLVAHGFPRSSGPPATAQIQNGQGGMVIPCLSATEWTRANVHSDATKTWFTLEGERGANILKF